MADQYGELRRNTRLSKIIEGDGDGVVHISKGHSKGYPICGQKNYNKIIYINDIICARIFVDCYMYMQSIQICRRCLSSKYVSTTEIGFVDMENYVDNFPTGIKHHRHPDESGYTKCGLPIFHEEKLLKGGHYMAGTISEQRRNGLLNCQLCSLDHISEYE